jgi:hypothetical protein
MDNINIETPDNKKRAGRPKKEIQPPRPLGRPAIYSSVEERMKHKLEYDRLHSLKVRAIYNMVKRYMHKHDIDDIYEFERKVLL